MVEVVQEFDMDFGRDTWIDEGNTTTNYGNDIELEMDDSTTAAKRVLLMIALPPDPIATNDSVITKVELRMYANAVTGNKFGQIYKSDKDWLEGDGTGGSGATWLDYDGQTAWTTAGGDKGDFVHQWNAPNPTTGVGNAFRDLTDYYLAKNIMNWSQRLAVQIEFGTETDSGTVKFDSSEGTNKPGVRLTYIDQPPTAITDLNTGPSTFIPRGVDESSEDPRHVKLAWTSNTDADFVQYKIYRHTSSPVTTSHTLLATITDQATESYTETDAQLTTAGTKYFYAIFVEDANNTGTDSTKSNEATARRPDITLATDIDPVNIWNDFLGQITLVSTTLIMAKYFFDWGDGGDGWFTWGGTAALQQRKHQYTFDGTKTIKARVESTEGLWSDIETDTIGVTTLNPEADIRASPTTAKVNELITLDATRSIARDSSVGITQYEFDFGDGGGFEAPVTTPVITTSYATTGTRTVRVRVTDGNTNTDISPSPNPLIDVQAISVTFLNLSAEISATSRGITWELSPRRGAGFDGSKHAVTSRDSESLRLQGSFVSEVERTLVRNAGLNKDLVDIKYPSQLNTIEILRGLMHNFVEDKKEAGVIITGWEADLILSKRHIKVVDEVVTYALGVGTVANTPLADGNSDGLVNASDVDVEGKTVSSIVASSGEVTLTDAGFNGTAKTTYYYEVGA